MPSRTENIYRVRDLLDLPYPNKPSFHQLLRGELSEEQDLCNVLNNTGKPWNVSTYQLNYYPGQTSFDINVSDFGKVLFVVRLTNNPYIPALPVPFEDLAELQYGTIWNSFYNFYNGWGAYTLPETIEKMAFYRTGTVDQSIKVQIQPAPQSSAVYEISYLAGYMGNDDPLESQMMLPEFANLVQLRNAMAMLPYTQWSEDRAADMDRKKELMMAFQYQLERKERLFAEYKASINTPRKCDVEDWNYAS